MSQHKGDEEHEGEEEEGGLLIRGADGSLWFVRDNANAPEKVEEEIAESITRLLDRGPQREFSGLSPEVQEILKKRLGIPAPSGIVHIRVRRPPRP